MSEDPIRADAVLSSAEMRAATGLPDLTLMGSMRAAAAPVGYELAEPSEAEALLFQGSGQDFLVWCQPFLSALAKYGTVGRACREAGITRREYRLAQQWQHGFTEAVQDAQDDYADALEERALMVAAPFDKRTDEESGVTTEEPAPPFEKAYGLLWRIMQGRKPRLYGGKAAAGAKPLSSDQKRFLIEAIVRQGFSRSEAESMVDLGASAMTLSGGGQ